MTIPENFLKLGSRIEHAHEFMRVDTYLAKKYPFLSRVKWQKRIKKGDVRVTSQERAIETQLKTTYNLKKYDQIWYLQVLPSTEKKENPDCNTAAQIDVIYDDGDVCIFSKPPHMVVHPVGIYGQNNFLTHIANMGYRDCSPVHRIDRETSGILVCARKSKTRREISQLFRENKIKKFYLAITKGTTSVSECFVVDAPIGVPENSAIRLKLCVNGRNCVSALTEFHLLAKKDNFHLFACFPKTGRTNQIRIHLASIGQWIVGDKMYHPDENVFLEFYEKGYTDWVHENVLFPRHLLHNAGISIPGFTQGFIFSKIPQDMATYPMAEELLKYSLR